MKKTKEKPSKTEVKTIAARYAKIVRWSDEDRIYIGQVPALGYGGVHGSDPAKVFAETCLVAEELVEIALQDGRPLPAEKQYSGKFVLRAGKELHEALAVEANARGESLNDFTVAAIRRGLAQ